VSRLVKFLLPLTVLILLLAAAVTGFSYFEHLSFSESLWMTITTVLTVGYGDIIPRTGAGRMLVIILVPLCILLITYFMGIIIGAIIELQISTMKRSKSMERKIKRINGHIIVCGLNQMSQIIIERIRKEKRDFVVIEADENKCEPFLDSYKIIIGDPSEEEVLKRAGIERADGLITTGTDAENVITVLTARGMNSRLRITSSAERTENESKLIKAGADKVINPELIGGTRIALSVLKPAAADYIDRVFTGDNESFKINELFLSEGCILNGQTIRKAEIRNKYNLSVMAVKRKGSIYTSNIADFQLEENDTLIVFGSEENIVAFMENTLADSI